MEDTALMGLVLNYVISLVGSTYSQIKYLGYFYKDIIIAERLKEYVECKIHEADFNSPPVQEDWPNQGKIEIQNLNVRYRENLPLVLKNLNFIVLSISNEVLSII